MQASPSARNPFRPVNWRWERAEQIVRGVLPYSSRIDDAWTRRAVDYRKALADCESPLDFALLAEEVPDLYWAHQIDQSVDRASRIGAMRYEIEARVLAAEAPKAIAKKVGVTPADVLAYEAVFFDARSKLDTPAYIQHMVIGPAVHRGLDSRDYDLFWKLSGYMRGPAYLDAMIATYGSPRTKVDAADVVKAMEADQSFAVLRVSMLAAKTFRIHSESQTDAIDLYCKLKEIERRGDDAAAVASSITAGIKEFFEASSLLVGKPNAESADQAIECADHEQSTETLLRLASGRDVDAEDAELAAAKFPEHRRVGAK